MSFQIPPTPSYEKDLKKLEKIYKQAFLDIVEQLKNVQPYELLKIEVYEAQLRQLGFIIKQLNKDSYDWIDRTLNEAFEYSLKGATVSRSIEEARTLLEAKGEIEFSLYARDRIDALISDTYADVLQATTFMENSLKDLIREVQSAVISTEIAKQRGSVTMAKNLRQEMLAKGFSKSLLEENWKGIIDARGNRWDLTTYTKMLAKTKLQQAQFEGAKARAQFNETDLAIISSHGAKDACRFFEGMIISLEGKTSGFKSYTELKNSQLIFHPNCQHQVHPIGDYEALPATLKQKSAEKEAVAEGVLKDPQRFKNLDNKKRYLEKKKKLKKVKEARRKNLEKARQKKEELKNPMKYNWVEAKSLQEANNWAKLNLGIKHVDYKGFELEFANDLNKHLEILGKQYPEVMESIKFVGTAQERNRLYYQTSLEQIYKNMLDSPYGKRTLERFGEEAGKKHLMAKAKELTYKPSPVKKNVWAQATNHTWGDYAGITYNKEWSKDYEAFKRSVAHSVKTKWHPEGTESPLSVLTHEFGHSFDYFLENKGLRDRYIGIVNEALKKDYSWFQYNLSEYAMTNDREVIAEAFAEYKHNPNPRPFAKKLGKAMEDALEEYRRNKK